MYSMGVGVDKDFMGAQDKMGEVYYLEVQRETPVPCTRGNDVLSPFLGPLDKEFV